MNKLALAIATTAILGFAAPGLAADSDTSGTTAQTQAPATQTPSPSAQTQAPGPSAQTQTPSPSAQTQTPTSQAKANVNAKATHKAKMAHHNRRMNKLARHERGLHRGSMHPGYYAYAKPHHEPLHHRKTMTHY